MSRPIGSAAELERRRQRAVQAVREGQSPEVIARTFGVHRCSVYRWLRLAQQPDGLAATPHPGPTPRLSPSQLRQLDELLRQGPRAHGWRNQLWTCARIVEVIKRHFGVRFHHDHVGRILRRRLHWTPQKPSLRPRQRDEAAIAFWKAVTFPKIAQKARARGAHLVFLDESGYMLTPPARYTWGPCGQTPVYDGWQSRERLSAISCLTVSPQRCRLNLYFQLLPDTVHGAEVVGFLRQLKRALPGPLTVLWDGGRVHSICGVVKEYLAQHPEIVDETLPAYAPELNPDELVWGWTKNGPLANLALDNTDQVAEHVIDELLYLKSHPHLLASFIDYTELPMAA